MTFSISNLDKPSNANFKRISDILLYLLPLYTPAIAALQPVSPVFALWVITIMGMVTVTLKGISKFTADEATTVDETVVEPADDATVEVSKA